jgi:hypothetical protein
MTTSGRTLWVLSLIAVVIAGLTAGCTAAPPAQGTVPPAAATSPASATASPTTAPPTAAGVLPLGPLEPGLHTAHFHVPFTFQSEAGWSVLSDATDNVALADANDQTSFVTFARPSGVTAGLAADALVKLLRPKSATAPSPATMAGVSGARFEYVAGEDVQLFGLGEPAGLYFGLHKGEKARFFIALQDNSPLVVVIEASDPETFTAFAPRAEKLLATVKFQR